MAGNYRPIRLPSAEENSRAARTPALAKKNAGKIGHPSLCSEERCGLTAEEKVAPLRSILFDRTSHSLYPLFGAVAFVLLIACLNVANLVQSRTETRRKEYALRSSLGAGRRRLIQQLLTESGLLALSGGLLGTALTYAGIKLLLALAGEFPNASDVGIDGRVLLFTLGISLLTAILFGLAPAIQASRPDLNVVLRESERKTITGSGRLARHALAIAEVALATVLLVGAGLMINTMLH